MKRLSLFILILFPGIFIPAAQIDVHAGSGNLENALATAGTGDTLCLNAGDYYLTDQLVIEFPMAIIGCGEAVLHAAEDRGILTVRAADVWIEGLTFRNVGRSYLEDLAAIWVDNSTGFTLLNNRIDNCFFGIFCTKSDLGRIEGNVVEGQAEKEAQSANAIHLWYCDSLSIFNNQVSGHRDGIYLEFTGNSVISGNESRNHLRYGLHYMYSHHNAYTGNTFENNGAGVAVMFSNFITMTGNTFIHNWGAASYGLLLKEIRDSRIAYNDFRRNTMGIFMEGCSRVQVERNAFTANGWALKVRGSSDDNDFTGNCFQQNSFDLASEARINPNRYRHNYWDRYSGYDLNRDGVGDVPHHPMSLFSHMTTRWEESILLMRSNFVEALNYAESVAPALTPSDLTDEEPLIRPASAGVNALNTKNDPS